MRTLLRATNRSLAQGLVRRGLLRDSIVVFLYHEVEDVPSAFNKRFDLSVTPATFRRQLELIGQDFHFISPDELLSGDHQTPAALVTFDDGDAGYVRHALPILKEKGIPSVCFVNFGPARGELCAAAVGAYVEYVEPRSGTVDGHFTRLPYSELVRQTERVASDVALSARVRDFRGDIATFDELQALGGEPLVYLGSHLYNHYNAAMLPQPRLVEEYWKNQDLLNAHPRGTRLFSYPFGQPGESYTDQTTNLLFEQGASIVFSAYALPNFVRRGRFYNRVAMYESIRTREELVAGVTRNYLRTRCGFGAASMC